MASEFSTILSRLEQTLEQMLAEVQCFGPDQLGIGFLQRFSRAERRQEYAEHIRTFALDSWGCQLLAPHIPELYISPLALSSSQKLNFRTVV